MKKKLLFRSLSLGFVFMFGLMFDSSAYNQPFVGFNTRQQNRATAFNGDSFLTRLNICLDSMRLGIISRLDAFNAITTLLRDTIHANELFGLINERELLTIDEVDNVYELYRLLGFDHELNHSDAVIELNRLLDFPTGTNFSVEYLLSIMIYRTGFSLGIPFYNGVVDVCGVDIVELVTSFIDILVLQRSEDLANIDNMLRFASSIDNGHFENRLETELLSYMFSLYFTDPLVSRYISRIQDWFDSASL